MEEVGADIRNYTTFKSESILAFPTYRETREQQRLAKLHFNSNQSEYPNESQNHCKTISIRLYTGTQESDLICKYINETAQ